MKGAFSFLFFGLWLAAQPVPVVRGTTPVRAPVVPNDAPTPSVKPEDKCTVEGSVVNSITGEPLKKAHLSLRPLGAPGGTPYGAETDGAGHFLFDGVDPGRYILSISRNGFVNQQYSPQGSSRQSSPLDLAAGQKLKQLVVKLSPQGVISGRVLDEDGEPLANANVMCMVLGYQRGRKQLMGRNGASTDDRGEFRLHGLSPGKYILSATYRPPGSADRVATRAPGTEPVEQMYPTTFYPNTRGPENASRIEIAPGAQITGLTMTLQRVKAVHVSGHVNTSAIKQPARNSNVMLVPRDNAGLGTDGMTRVGGRLDPRGNFMIRGVAPGSYLLRADSNDESGRLSARMPLEVGDSNIDGIELNLQPPGQIHGHVVVEENGDLAGATLSVTLRPKTNGPGMGGAGAQLNADHTFVVQNITQDAFDISVNGLPDGFYLKSIRMGQQDVTETGVDFSQGVSADEMTIVVNPNGGEVDGTVQNSQGEIAAGAIATLIPEEAHRSTFWLYKTANTDQNGHFTMKGVRPGKYSVYAWDDMDSGAYQDPDFVRPHESAGEKLSIDAGAHQNVQLKSIPAENNNASR